MADRTRARSTSLRMRRVDEREYRLLMAVGFPFFLLATVIARLLPSRWGARPPEAAPGRSIFAEARTAASIAIPFAFRG